MTVMQQQKGRSHINYIRDLAIVYWSDLDWKEGMYPTCLRDAMKEHRDYLIRCAEEQRKIAVEKTHRCKDCMTPLGHSDLFHYGYYCRDCFACRMNNEVRDDYYPVPPQIPVPPRLPMTPAMPNPRLIL